MIVADFNQFDFNHFPDSVGTHPYVITFNGRSGAVDLTASDVQNALGFVPLDAGGSVLTQATADDLYAPIVHTHSIANVTGLQAALDGKQVAGSYAAASHTHVIADVTGLTADLASKLDDSQAGVFGLTLLGSVNLAAAKTSLAYTKSDIGLGNVDNTSDVNKPVSTATQTALNTKANLAGGNAFTGNQIVTGDVTATHDLSAGNSFFAGIGGASYIQCTTNANGFTGDLYAQDNDGTVWYDIYGADSTGKIHFSSSHSFEFDHDLLVPDEVYGAGWNASLEVPTKNAVYDKIEAVVATIPAAGVPTTRNINTTAPLTGGGDLSADRTLAISAATSGAAGSMSAADKTKLDAITGTNTGDQTSIVGITGTLAQFNTALTGADFVSGGGTATGTNTGDQTITLTGDVTGSGTGSFVTAVGANKITRAMMATTGAATVLGSTAAGAVTELTAAQTKTFLAIANTDVSGLGTASTANTGTSGHTIPYLDAANTFTGSQTVTGDVTASGGVRAKGALTGAAGLAVDMYSDGTNGIIQAYNSTSAAYANLIIKGFPVRFAPNGGTTMLDIGTTGMTLSGTFTVGAVTTFNSSGVLQAAALPAFSGGDVTSSAGSASLAIGANKVTRGMMVATAGATILGSTAAGNIAELTAAQSKTFLAIAESDVTNLTTDLAAKAPKASPQFTGVSYFAQPTPTAKNTTATLTIAEILTLIITTTSASAVSLTLPTGTLTDAGILSGALAVDEAFEWYTINLGSASGAVTLLAGVAHTIVGNAVVAISTTARWLTRKTATNTFVTYRIA